MCMSVQIGEESLKELFFLAEVRLRIRIRIQEGENDPQK
jgi:hypothetical protein